jgi:hypothetical protein
MEEAGAAAMWGRNFVPSCACRLRSAHQSDNKNGEQRFRIGYPLVDILGSSSLSETEAAI